MQQSSININMGVIYNAAIKIGKACKPKWYRYTPKPTTTPSLSVTQSKTPEPSSTNHTSSTPSISPSPSPTPSISYSLSSTPVYTPTPSQSVSRYPSNTPTPSVTPSNSVKPGRHKKSFIEKLLEWLKSIFS